MIGMKNKIIFYDSSAISSNSKEALRSILPVSLIILILLGTLTPVESGVFLAFLLGAFLVVFGMGLFTLGADTAMTPIGQYVSASVIKTKKLWIILPLFFLVGVFITVSEPDLQVLAGQLSDTVSTWFLLIVVGVGVGVFLVMAILRLVFRIKLKLILILSYVAVFTLSFFVPENFIPLSFDSGGVTTGPMSVPFIIALGTGISYLRTDKGADDDGFGFTALCSVGPIIAVMILGVIFRPESVVITSGEELVITNSKDLFSLFLILLPKYLKEVGIALLPIVGFFIIVRIFGGKISKSDFIKILIGIFYTYFGLVLFLLGINAGFLPLGDMIGRELAAKEYSFVIIPIAMLLGYFVVAAEPAVQVLTKQVYEITGGAIPKKAMKTSLMIGVGIAVGLAFLRIYFSINIMYFLAPMYGLAILLSFFSPDLFTAIAFDSGGVASGALTASFLLPMALGFCEGLGRDVGQLGFGLVAFVAATPLITIQLLGIIFKLKNRKARAAEDKTAAEETAKAETEEIID